ncbi:unnamed protein product, partial [marine sediment metagenome]
ATILETKQAVKSLAPPQPLLKEIMKIHPGQG